MADYLDAQRVLLGSMLIDPQIIGHVTTAIRADDFTDAQCRRVYDVLRAMYLDGETVDWPLVRARMGTEDATAVLTQIRDWTPTAANWRAYLREVQQQARIRRIQSVAINLCGLGMTLDAAAPLIAELNALMAGRPGVECLSMEQAILNFYDEMEQKPEYLPWGFDFLDEGLTAEAGDFIVIGGYPSDGKTAFALATAYAQARTKRVGFFSLETKPSKLFNRLFSAVAQVSGKHIKYRELDEEDGYKLERKTDEIRARNLFLIRASGMTVDDIRSYARAREYDVIYVDYLQLIQDAARDEVQKVTNISKGLHELAQSCNITVVALSQLSRGESKDKKRPTLRSLRSSGQIEQDADVVMLLYREEPEALRSRRILHIAKNKEGETGQFPLRFKGDMQTFIQDISGSPIKKAEPEPRQTSFPDLPGSEYEEPGDERYKVPF